MTDSGVVSVGGTTAVTIATTENVILDSANTFTGAMTFTAGDGGVGTAFGNVTVKNSTVVKLDTNADTAGDLYLNAATDGTVGGNLSITSGGAITQGIQLGVTGSAGFKTLNDTPKGITLSNAANTFGAITAQARNAADNADVSGAIAISEGAAMAIADISTTGTLSLTTTGALTQSGAIGAGAVTVSASGQDVTLTNASNAMTSVSITGANIDVTDSDGIDIAAITSATTLDVIAGDAITDSGTITVSGAATFMTKKDLAAAITLNTSGVHTFGSVKAETRNAADNATVAGAITIDENAAMDIAGLTTTSTVSLITAGAITDSGAIAAGAITINTTAGADAAARAVTIAGQTTNATSWNVSTTDGAISIDEDSATDLAAITTTGTLSLTTDRRIDPEWGNWSWSGNGFCQRSGCNTDKRIQCHDIGQHHWCQH